MSQMNYYDVFLSRINHMGDTIGERIRNGGIRSFNKWLAESPHTIRNLSVERGLFFSGIILTNKDKEHEKIMFLNVSLDIPIEIGDIMNLTLDDGSIEKWLLVQEEKKINGTYRTFWIVRCNYLIKWFDSNGHLQSSWCYFVSSLDSKIKGNFRTWNSLITPQPNKYAEILMPRRAIDRATNFIVEEEAWTVVEYDHSSVPGVIYLSLTESKINSIYDDVENDIADLDKEAKYYLDIPEQIQNFSINDPIEIKFTLMKNGLPCKEDLEFISTDKKIVKNINGKLVAIKEGDADIIVRLKNYPEISQTVKISINNSPKEFSAYLEGPDKIKLDRKAQYKLNMRITPEDGVQVDYSLSDDSYAKIISIKDNICEVRANDKNILGTVILTAKYNDNTYNKEISIIPLW